VVDEFEQLPESRWMALDEFSSWLQRTRPSLVREQLNPRGLVRLQAASWSDLERPLLSSFVLGPLYWLGMVSTSSDGRHIARRSRPSASGTVDSARGADSPRAHEPCRWEAAAEHVAPPPAQLRALLAAVRYRHSRDR